MYKLYARPGSGSLVVEAMLEIAGAGFQTVPVEKLPDGSPPPHVLAVNPLGQVPVLVLPDGTVMTESAAIIIYLTETHPDAGLAPAAGSPLRPAFLRWTLFLATQLYPDVLRYYYPHRYSTDPADTPAIREQARKHMERDYDLLAQALGKGPFLLGETFSACDLYACMLVNWAADLEALFTRQPGLKAMYEAVASMPQIGPVWARNDM